MKRVMLVSATALAAAVVSLSSAMADGYERRAAVYAAAPAFSWTGMYIGLHTGWERKDIEGSDFTAMNTTTGNLTGDIVRNFVPGTGQDLASTGALTKQSIDGWIGGGQVGYNHQFGRVVVGTELSVTWGNVNGTETGFGSGGTPNGLSTNACFSGNNFTTRAGESLYRSCDAEQRWSAQWLNKLGLAHDRLLGYLAGGVALTDVKITRVANFTQFAPLAAATSNAIWGGDANYVGVVLGGGLQYALTNNISIGVEYLHTQYAAADTLTSGTRTFTGAFAPTPAAPFLNPQQFHSNATDDLSSDTIRAVLNYKFDFCCAAAPLK